MCCDSEGTVVNLSTNEPNEHFRFKHAEADTKLISLYAKLRAIGKTESVIIDSEITDVYVVRESCLYLTSYFWKKKVFIKRKGVLVN